MTPIFAILLVAFLASLANRALFAANRAARARAHAREANLAIKEAIDQLADARAAHARLVVLEHDITVTHQHGGGLTISSDHNDRLSVARTNRLTYGREAALSANITRSSVPAPVPANDGPYQPYDTPTWLLPLIIDPGPLPPAACPHCRHDDLPLSQLGTCPWCAERQLLARHLTRHGHRPAANPKDHP